MCVVSGLRLLSVVPSAGLLIRFLILTKNVPRYCFRWSGCDLIPARPMLRYVSGVRTLNSAFGWLFVVISSEAPLCLDGVRTLTLIMMKCAAPLSWLLTGLVSMRSLHTLVVVRSVTVVALVVPVVWWVVLVPSVIVMCLVPGRRLCN